MKTFYITFMLITLFATSAFANDYPCDWNNSPKSCARIAYNVEYANTIEVLEDALEEAEYKVFLLETMLKQDNVIVSNNLKATNSNRNRNTSISSSAAYSSADREQGV